MNPTLIQYQGSFGADSEYPGHLVANAFKPQTTNAPFASAQDRVPATVWYRFNSKKFVSRISITSRKGHYWEHQSPKSVYIVASNDCKTWKHLGYWENLGFTAGAQTKTMTIPCESQGSYQCYGIKTTAVRISNTGCRCASFVDMKMYG